MKIAVISCLRKGIAIIDISSKIRGIVRPGSIRSHVMMVMTQSGVEAGVMMIASLLAARWFGPILWGQLGMLLAGVQLITMMSDGFAMSLVRFIAGSAVGDSEAAQSAGWRLAWLTAGINCGLAIIVGLAGWVATGCSANANLIILAVLLATVRTSRAAFDSTFRALRTFTPPTIIGIVCSTAMAACIIYFSAKGHRVAAYIGVLVVFTGLNTLLLSMSYRNRFSIAPHAAALPPGRMREYLNYSMPLVLRGLSGFLFLKINIWLLGYLATAGDAGQFRLTDQFLTIPALVFSAVLTAIAPRVTEAQQEGLGNLSDLCAKMYGLMILVSVPVALFFLFNKFALDYLFPGFGEASKMMMIFAPVVLIRGVSNSSSLILMQGGKPKVAFWLAFLPSIANIVCALVGYRLGGVMGLVIGTAIVHFTTYIITIVVTHNLFKLPYRVRFM